MNEYRDRQREILDKVKNGELQTEEALAALQELHYADMGYALLDTHRRFRKGFAEAIYCPGKTVAQVAEIAQRLRESTEGNILATRATEEMYLAVRALVPEAEYHSRSGVILLPSGVQEHYGNILVISAGTADQPVAEEALLTARAMGNKTDILADVGVSGLHRLLSHTDRLQEARVLVVCAGMDGALPSVVAGLVPRPVVAVPTSVGYGANFQGLAPLLAMLNSCATGVMTVNIDNGFGAGYAASLINRVG
jgi:NCAIR mutase (PurE)-related protein